MDNIIEVEILACLQHGEVERAHELIELRDAQLETESEASDG